MSDVTALSIDTDRLRWAMEAAREAPRVEPSEAEGAMTIEQRLARSRLGMLTRPPQTTPSGGSHIYLPASLTGHTLGRTLPSHHRCCEKSSSDDVAL